MKSAPLLKKFAFPVFKALPKSARKGPIQTRPPTPEEWAAVQPPPDSALVAFAHRIGIGEVRGLADNPRLLRQACTHSSFTVLYEKYHLLHNETDKGLKKLPPLEHNAHLATMGNALLGMFTTEYLAVTYPHLPTRVLRAAVVAYGGSLSCSAIATETGAVPLLRWARVPFERDRTILEDSKAESAPTDPSTPRKMLLHATALASIPRSLLALIYKHTSLASCRLFAHRLFLSRTVDIKSMLKFHDPKRALLELLQSGKYAERMGVPEDARPISRILKESGRFSNTPVFVVGIFVRDVCVGEGFGSSLKMAEYRASEDALRRLYLTKAPYKPLSSTSSPTPLPGEGWRTTTTDFSPPSLDDITPYLPSSTFPPSLGSVYDISLEPGALLKEGEFIPPETIESEGLYESGYEVGKLPFKHPYGRNRPEHELEPGPETTNEN